ncbi:MAG: DUF465 domain-containing protein [Thermoanaerobaculia bacterium]|nr:DUF465 domain-containing protein [Thermoanaerobaculia bacterium]
MAQRNENVRRSLSREDEEFRSWKREHRKYEMRLAELAEKAALTPDEELEEKQLKKRKLNLKDRMAVKIRQQSASTT